VAFFWIINNFHRPPLKPTEVALTSVGHPSADRSYVNFRRLALADRNYVISVGFPSSRQKILWPIKSSIFPVVRVIVPDLVVRGRN
jgi:hypothetical protein